MRIRSEGGLTGKNASSTLATASGMWTMHDVSRNVRNGIWPLDTGQADPYFNLNTLLIHADGTSNANNSTVIDSSIDKIPFTNTYSAFFDGTSSYVTAPAGSGFAYGTGDFTVEAWVYATSIPDGASGALIWSQTTSGTNYFMIGVSPAGRTSFTFATSGGGTSILGPATNIVLNTWNHVAVVRSSNLVTVYLNGVGGTATSCTQNFTDTSFVPTIGRYTHSGSIYWAGYISNVRVVKGTAVYTSNFTPPTSALTAISGTSLLTLQSSTFIDNSASALTVTSSGSTVSSGNYPFPLTRTGDGIGQGSFTPFSQPAGYWSNYFNGSAYHTLPAFNIGTDDFTIECWFNSTAVSSTEYPVFKLGTSTQFCEIRINTAKVQGRVNDGATVVGGNTTITAGTWYHVALVRSSGVDRLYINGVVESTTANDTTNYSFSSGRIGANQTPNIYYTGFISNFRIVIGTAVYTSNFTVPTAPLSAVSGSSTYLLACQNNNFRDSSVNNTTLTPTSVQATPLSPFAPTSTYSASSQGGSYSFDGVADYMRVAANNAFFGFGTGDFTIEYWAYFNSVASGQSFDLRNIGSFSQTKPTIYFSSSGTLAYYTGGSARITFAPTTGQWYHIAAVRSSGVTKFYLNGVANTTTYTDTNDYGSVSPLTIGSAGDNPGGASNFHNGYITNVRVIKGIPAYTSNFTPPTEPLTANSATSFLLTGTNAGIIDQAGKNDIATVGGARLSTTQSRFGGTSIFLNGTTDFIKLHDFSGSVVPGATVINGCDFTIEGWFLSAGSASTQTVFQINGLSTSFAAVRLDWTTSNALQLLVSSSGTAWAINYTPSGALSNSLWYHIAVVRSGTSFSIYVDGTLRGAEQTLSGALTAGTGFSYFGALNNSTMQQFFNGYMEEIRISRYARYTSSFSPANQQFLDR